MPNTPTLLIHKEKVIRNIRRMAEKASRSGVIFRPHFKTHQSAEVGDMFRQQGVDRITVSSVSMAQFFAKHGWDDITIAFPVNLREMDAINTLASQIHLHLLADSPDAVLQLADKLKYPAGLFIELDNGYGRSGLTTDQAESMKEIVRITENAENMTFKGFLTHAGNTYNARGKQEIMVIMEDTAGQLRTLKARYADRFPGIITSYGDTPSCSLAEDLSAFDEIRPGNFVYYDVMQYHIGSCTLDDIAVCVACPVVGIYPERNELVIYGGAVHLSKEFIAGDNGFKLFGYIVETDGNDWSEPVPGAYVSSLSQEHGVVHMPSEWISKFKPGDLLGVLPVHSCLAADVLNDAGLPAEA